MKGLVVVSRLRSSHQTPSRHANLSANRDRPRRRVNFAPRLPAESRRLTHRSRDSGGGEPEQVGRVAAGRRRPRCARGLQASGARQRRRRARSDLGRRLHVHQSPGRDREQGASVSRISRRGTRTSTSSTASGRSPFASMATWRSCKTSRRSTATSKAFRPTRIFVARSCSCIAPAAGSSS